MNEEQQAAYAKALATVLADLRTPAYADKIKFLAQDAFARHTAYVKAGFTSEQALHLIMYGRIY